MKSISTLFIITLIWVNSLWALDANSTNTTQKSSTLNVENLQQKREDAKHYLEGLEKIEGELKNSTMHARYNNHQTYLEIEKHLKEIKKEMKKAKQLRQKKALADLTVKYKSLENQLDLLGDFKEEPFIELTKPNEIPEPPKVDTPFDIFSGFTYVKLLKKDRDEYSDKLNALLVLLDRLEEQKRELQALEKLYDNDARKEQLASVMAELEHVSNTYELARTTNEIYQQKVNDSILKTTNEIKAQMKKLLNIIIIIGVILLFSFLLKYFAKKTISDNERYYMAHKGINFTNLVLIALVLLFSFLENATYLVTVLGFASAGIAIAMKDLFMSSLGWLVIVFGGSFHVGDRVKVYKGAHSYVGDIVDISFLRMTILEDVTLTTISENGRAGRIIFIPNNYIFTELIANYTHGKIKTVWDGIDIMITFDSNHKKATHIIKEIVKKYSKGYTDISRKQLNALRNQYSLKNINVEPRIYTFVEKSGIRVSCWYMTNSYATLTLRSNIFANIIDEINAEDDIKIAYDTQIINIKRDNVIVSDTKDEGEESLS
jgi:small-conductance mechanosensitive channel